MEQMNLSTEELSLLDIASVSAMSGILGNNVLLSKLNDDSKSAGNDLQTQVAMLAYSQSLAMIKVRKSLGLDSRVIKR